VNDLYLHIDNDCDKLKCSTGHTELCPTEAPHSEHTANTYNIRSTSQNLVLATYRTY